MTTDRRRPSRSREIAPRSVDWPSRVERKLTQRSSTRIAGSCSETDSKRPLVGEEHERTDDEEHE
jgi:hypothetical protein